MMAAACGTGTTSDISGTASAPKPPRKPLLESPIINTAGTATAQKAGSESAAIRSTRSRPS